MSPRAPLLCCVPAKAIQLVHAPVPPETRATSTLISVEIEEMAASEASVPVAPIDAAELPGRAWFSDSGNSQRTFFA